MGHLLRGLRGRLGRLLLRDRGGAPAEAAPRHHPHLHRAVVHGRRIGVVGIQVRLVEWFLSGSEWSW